MSRFWLAWTWFLIVSGTFTSAEYIIARTGLWKHFSDFAQYPAFFNNLLIAHHNALPLSIFVPLWLISFILVAPHILIQSLLYENHYLHNLGTFEAIFTSSLLYITIGLFYLPSFYPRRGERSL